MEIVVLQRGWVVVGDVAEDSEQVLRLTGASVIRRWGTDKGLGQLAREGPRPSTQLDPCGEVRVHPLAVVLRLSCEPQAWAR